MSQGARLSPPTDDRAARARGQSLVEFTLVIPLFLLILLAMLEFGFAFNHRMTLEYATREGARAGAAMANGTITDSACVDAAGVPRALTAADVDPLVIAAVQRVLESPGSMVRLDQIGEVRIYKANASGGEAGPTNVWVYAKGAGPAVPCMASPPNLDFRLTSGGWSASGRSNGINADSIGVSITYTYRFNTPLQGILRFLFGSSGATLPITDRSVMALNPTN